jgi:8-oxo-dGTP pyrophosphatase MutT (NUDIX family)
MKKTAKVMYETPGGWMKIKKDYNSNFYYAERKGIDSVAIILNDKNGDGIGLINEVKPPFNERYQEKDMHFKATALGGSLFDMGFSEKEWLALSEKEKQDVAAQTALKEVREETGYQPNYNDIQFVGKVVFNSMSNEYVWLFVAHVDKENQGKPDPQCENEARANVEWVDGKASYEEIFRKITCGKALAIMMKYVTIAEE